MAELLFISHYEDEDKQDEEQYYAWSDSLSCGNGDVDADHRRLLDIAERVRTADMQGQDDAVVGHLLLELMEYVQGHFAREEALMQDVNYPGLADHQFEHGLLIQRVQSLHREFLDGQRVANKEMWQFLRRWLRYHIMNADVRMALFASKAPPSQTKIWEESLFATVSTS